MTFKGKDKLWKEFNNSKDWMSLCICPLSWKQMVIAVSNGDAELKVTTYDEDDIPDTFFRWKRDKNERWYNYFPAYLPEIFTKSGIKDVLNILEEDSDFEYKELEAKKILKQILKNCVEEERD